MKMMWLALVLAVTPGLKTRPPGEAATPQRATVLVPLRIEPRAVERIYNDAIIKDGGIDQVVKQLAAQSGHPLDLRRMRRDEWMNASRQAHQGEYEAMGACIRAMLRET